MYVTNVTPMFTIVSTRIGCEKSPMTIRTHAPTPQTACVVNALLFPHFPPIEAEPVPSYSPHHAAVELTTVTFGNSSGFVLVSVDEISGRIDDLPVIRSFPMRRSFRCLYSSGTESAEPHHPLLKWRYVRPISASLEWGRTLSRSFCSSWKTIWPTPIIGSGHCKP